MCGAVAYTVTAEITQTGACHCEKCRKWTGGVFLGIEVPADGMDVKGTENLTIFASSPWAERAFCKTCGSNLYYRLTAPGPHHGVFHVGLGGLDDPNGIKLASEIFIDKKPDGYAFAGETDKMTAAEMMALFAPPA